MEMPSLTDNNVQLFALAYPVNALGPGNRVVLWVAGCSRACPGCISPEMQNPLAGAMITVERLAQRLLTLDLDLAGITISGGEPFDQAPALAHLLDLVRPRHPEWSVIVYTGYLLEELKQTMAGKTLLTRVDLVIDGPYLCDVPSEQALAGSGNQCFHYLTERGESLRGYMESAVPGAMNVGLGRGDFNMIIGVTDESARSAVCRGMGLDTIQLEKDICSDT